MTVYRSWLKTFFTVFAVLLIPLLLTNILADPMMVLPFVHKWNNRVRFINERQQKTNQLFFSAYYGTHDFNGIILGSSRTSMIEPALFSPTYNIYNYAAAAFRPDEALTYLKFAKQVHGKDLDIIILGLDFMGANGQKSKSGVKGGRPVSYVEEVHKPLFTLANLLNLKAWHLATRILRANRRPTKESYYERDGMHVVEYFRPSTEEQTAAFNESMNIYRGIYHSFHYNPDYKTILANIKEQFPQTRFLIFTTPVAQPHLHMLAEENKRAEYEQWLKDIVEVFGSVWHFMDDNTVARRYTQYFSDSHHLYLRETNLIVWRMLQQPNEALPADFGKKLTAQNIEEYLNKLKF